MQRTNTSISEQTCWKAEEQRYALPSERAMQPINRQVTQKWTNQRNNKQTNSQLNNQHKNQPANQAANH
jgi:hypothetical protein